MPPRRTRKQTSKDNTTAKIEPNNLVEASVNSLNDTNSLPTVTTVAETEASKEIYTAESINNDDNKNNDNDNDNNNNGNNNSIENKNDNSNNDDDNDNVIITANESIKDTDISRLNISEINTDASNSEIDINNDDASIKADSTTVTPSTTGITFSYEVSNDPSNSNVVVKPSGFTCKRITFDEPSNLNKNSNDSSSELERRKKRAERFGTQLSDADKKLERAARFGFAIPNPLDSQLKSPRPSTPKKMSIVENEERLKLRAERFGLNKSTNETTDSAIKNTSPLSSLSEEEKKKRRAERFSLGSKSPSSVSPTSLSTISEEEKMKNRAEKFKTSTNDEPPNKKIKT